MRMRIHWGMGRFWAIFFARSVRFVYLGWERRCARRGALASAAERAFSARRGAALSRGFLGKLLYKPSFVRRQCRRFEFQRILLPVRMRIHWGMGRFWAIFFASVRFVRKVLCDGCGGRGRVRRRDRAGRSLSDIVCVCLLRERRSGRSQRAARPELALSGVGRSAGPPRSVAARARVGDFAR